MGSCGVLVDLFSDVDWCLNAEYSLLSMEFAFSGFSLVGVVENID